MVNDFKDYGWNADDHVHKIYSGKDKNTDKPIIISTWQSIYKFPKRYFDDFDCVIGDEAHLFKSKSLTGIIMQNIDLDLLAPLTVVKHISGYWKVYLEIVNV
jgi:superfamily II DNA or RNA helicase